jgi:hypothetical protein
VDRALLDLVVSKLPRHRRDALLAHHSLLRTGCAAENLTARARCLRAGITSATALTVGLLGSVAFARASHYDLTVEAPVGGRVALAFGELAEAI